MSCVVRATFTMMLLLITPFATGMPAGAPDSVEPTGAPSPWWANSADPDLPALAKAMRDWTGTETSTTDGGGGETFRFGQPGGDFDGDGRPDLLVDETSFDFATETVTKTWTAVNALGQPLWARTYAEADGFLEAIPVGFPDLDQDGATDALFLVLRADTTEGPAPCAGPACTAVIPFLGEWRLEAVRSTGDAIWTDVQPIVSAFVPTFTFVPAIGTGNQLLAEGATNHAYIPHVSSDHNGDDVPDIVVNQVHSLRADNSLNAFTSQGFVGIGGGAATYVTEYHIRSGTDGTVITSGVLPPATQPASVRPTHDIDNDGTPELVAVGPSSLGGGVGLFPFSAPEFHAVLLTGPVTYVGVLNGQDGSPEWVTALPDAKAWSTSAWPTGDLDGDGTPDLLVQAQTSEFRHTYSAISITSGAVLWSLDHDGIPLDDDDAAFAADLDADGRADPIFVSNIDLFGGGHPRIAARSGTGDDWLYDITLPLATSEPFLWQLVPLGDADSDGHPDFLYVEQGSQFGGFEPLASVRGIAGESGATEWAFTRDGFLEGAATGRLDAVGGDALLTWSTFDENGAAFHAEALAGETGATIWHQVSAEPGLVDYRIVALKGDADGDGRADLIANIVREETEGLASSVGLISGATATLQWQFP